jgi:hypothetical protein
MMNGEQLSLQMFKSAQTGIDFVGAQVSPLSLKTWDCLNKQELGTPKL